MSPPKPTVVVFAKPDVCCHWHRLVCPVQHYHGRENYRFRVEQNAKPQREGIDYLFVHGMIQPEEVGHLASFVECGTKLVWFLDDDYFNLPEWHHFRAKAGNVGAMWAVAGMSHAVVYTTDWLRASVEKRIPVACGKGFVAPNLLHPAHYPEPLWERRARRKKPLVMWVGCGQHEDDLALLIPVVEELHAHWQDTFDLEFFGSCHPEMRARWVGGWSREHEGCTFSTYPERLQDLAPDVMLCPLNDDSFARGRSDLKLKESMAKGAMVLYSPTGPFESFPYGVRCRTTEEWMTALVASAKAFKEGKLFWDFCRSSYEASKEEFFWGRNNSGQQTWNAVLDQILGANNG